VTSRRNSRWSFWSSPRALPLAAAVLATLAWLVFSPALNRVFAGDHLWYFAEVHGQSTLSAGLKLVDYAATRVYWRGDDVTFRPLLFTWMAVANALFSYHHIWWNAANLAIHVLIGVALFRLLAAIRASAFALAGAMLFIVLTPPIELVLWNHLGGYLLAWLCLAVALHAFAGLTGTTGIQPQASGPRAPDASQTEAAAQFAVAFAAGSFFYEALAVIGFVLALIVLWCDYRRSAMTLVRATVLLAPAALFTALYAWHATRVPRMGYIDGAIVQAPVSRLLNTLPLAFGSARHWLWEIAMPTTVTLSSRAFDRFTILVAERPQSPVQWANVVAVIAGLALVVRATSRRRIAETWPFLLGVVLAAAAYAVVLAFGRPSKDLFGVSYYTYVFGMLMIVFLYTLVDGNRLAPLATVSGLALTAALFALNASTTMGVVKGVETANRYQSRYLAKVVAFVDGHRHEPDFTFAIEAHPESLDPRVALMRGYEDERNAATESRRMTEILFEPYYRADRPKYLLDASATRVVSGAPLP